MSCTYALVKEAICTLLRDGAQIEASPAGVYCAPGEYEATTALPLALGLGAEALAARLRGFERARPAALYSAPLFWRIAHSEGRLCFSLTDAFLSAAVQETNAQTPLPALPPNIESRADYALCRMLMLARKGGDGCESEARAMVWSALGILERLNEKKALKLRLMLAAEHALGFGEDIPLTARMALYAKSGAAAACAARCIALGIGTL
ncbi:MAG: hypothetical protein ABFC62_07990 [Clostridiaceae bacterium]|nr:hypothetical protein [Eubacteriales bacterium]